MWDLGLCVPPAQNQPTSLCPRGRSVCVQSRYNGWHMTRYSCGSGATMIHLPITRWLVWPCPCPWTRSLRTKLLWTVSSWAESGWITPDEPLNMLHDPPYSLRVRAVWRRRSSSVMLSKDLKRSKEGKDFPQNPNWGILLPAKTSTYCHNSHTQVPQYTSGSSLHHQSFQWKITEQGKKWI